ncbi:MAG: O-antigen ligase family protein [Muribaculaceae bacterium]
MILICSFFIVSGLKRGAIIAGCAGVVIYFYYWLVELKHRRITSNSILVLLLSLIGGGLIYHFVTQNLFLLERFTELADGDSSGRDVIYSTIWDYWLLSDPWNMIFGYGFDASVDIVGKSAHNDWLELLSATGLVGIVIYFTFFVSFVRLVNISTISIYDKTMLMMIFTIWVFLSMFSMAYNDGGLSSMTTLMGYIVGKNEIRYAVK